MLESALTVRFVVTAHPLISASSQIIDDSLILFGAPELFPTPPVLQLPPLPGGLPVLGGTVQVRVPLASVVQVIGGMTGTGPVTSSSGGVTSSVGLSPVAFTITVNVAVVVINH